MNKLDQPREFIRTFAGQNGLTADDLISKHRSRRVSRLRQDCMRALYADFDLSLPEIGVLLGGRDTTTVRYGINASERRQGLPVTRLRAARRGRPGTTDPLPTREVESLGQRILSNPQARPLLEMIADRQAKLQPISRGVIERLTGRHSAGVLIAHLRDWGLIESDGICDSGTEDVRRLRLTERGYAVIGRERPMWEVAG